ncbi:hypothetical protein [Mycobacteroides abscessus]|uniref:hypothetical protein n=1 Tax=Mycobacteroides abscessus TaxID=36809 RepID=UPI0009D351A1|nr:hypothetical protein [Mycobacteroides abscessus]SKQ84516.1 LpqJ protein [Mycobacteroides abscessus subsp. massiliense]
MNVTSKLLSPDSHGQVYISTATIFRAMVTPEFIGCEADFTCAPTEDGYRATGVRADRDGSLTWIWGNLGHLPVIKLEEGVYNALDWDIVVVANGGLRVTNRATGKAFVVDAVRVEPA